MASIILIVILITAGCYGQKANENCYHLLNVTGGQRDEYRVFEHTSASSHSCFYLPNGRRGQDFRASRQQCRQLGSRQGVHVDLVLVTDEATNQFLVDNVLSTCQSSKCRVWLGLEWHPRATPSSGRWYSMEGGEITFFNNWAKLDTVDPCVRYDEFCNDKKVCAYLEASTDWIWSHCSVLDNPLFLCEWRVGGGSKQAVGGAPGKKKGKAASVGAICGAILAVILFLILLVSYKRRKKYPRASDCEKTVRKRDPIYMNVSRNRDTAGYVPNARNTVPKKTCGHYDKVSTQEDQPPPRYEDVIGGPPAEWVDGDEKGWLPTNRHHNGLGVGHYDGWNERASKQGNSRIYSIPERESGREADQSVYCEALPARNVDEDEVTLVDNNMYVQK